MLDVKDVQIFWRQEIGDATRQLGQVPPSWNGPSRITELVVADITQRNANTDWWCFSNQYDCNDGNCWRDWATAEGHGPEVVFCNLLVTGFKSPQHLIDAIGEFAKIRQCQWARDMLKPHVAERMGIV